MLFVMTTELLLALTGFALATLFSPGPNNLMLMASGANFGLRRTMPHLLGVATGFPMMAAAVGLGLGALFESWPPAETILKVLAAAILLWLAWKIANAAPPKEREAGGRPLTYIEATAFQWVNPKAWFMAIGAMSAYAATGGPLRVLAVAGVFLAFGLCSAATWTTVGTQLRRVLTSRARLRAFNWTMAALLVASLIPMLGA